MPPRSAARILSLAALASLLAFPAPGRAADADPTVEPEEEFEDEEGDLRERITEREDKRRPLEPFGVDVAGRELTIGGEYEIELGYLRRRVLGEGVEQPDRFLLEQWITKLLSVPRRVEARVPVHGQVVGTPLRATSLRPVSCAMLE